MSPKLARATEVGGGIASITESGTTATVTTNSPNGLLTGQAVVIAGITDVPAYNGTATVTVTTPTKFTYTESAVLASSTGACGTETVGLNGSASATILQDYTGSTLNAGNAVALPASGTSAPITGASWSAGVATITATNTFSVGQQVVIAGVTPSLYNGTYVITSVIGSGPQTGFTYTLPLTSVATAKVGSNAAGPITNLADAPASASINSATAPNTNVSLSSRPP